MDHHPHYLGSNNCVFHEEQGVIPRLTFKHFLYSGTLYVDLMECKIMETITSFSRFFILDNAMLAPMVPVDCVCVEARELSLWVQSYLIHRSG